MAKRKSSANKATCNLDSLKRRFNASMPSATTTPLHPIATKNSHATLEKHGTRKIVPAEAARQLPTRGLGRVNWQSALALFIGVREEPTVKGMNKDKVVAVTSRNGARPPSLERRHGHVMQLFAYHP